MDELFQYNQGNGQNFVKQTKLEKLEMIEEVDLKNKTKK